MDIQFGELHPLENSLVLSNIFEHCSVKDMKSCRLVCKLWLDASRLAWKSSAIAKINPNQPGKRMTDLKIFSRNYANDRGQILEQVPFTNFSLLCAPSAWFKNFWGASIKYLKLECVEFRSGKTFLKIIFNYCQNLDKLDLMVVTVKKSGVVRNDVEQIEWMGVQENAKLKSLVLSSFKWDGAVWMEVLNRIPSLQALTMKDNYHASSFQGLFQSLKTIRERSPTKLKLKHIDLLHLSDIPPEVVPVLLDTNLKLESLVLGPTFLRKFGHRLVDILNNHASSLKRLSLLGNLSAVRPENFQSQRQLEILQEFNNYGYLKEDYSLVNFLKHAPNLRKITFRSYSRYNCLGIEGISGLEDINLNYCTELRMHLLGLTTVELEHLIRWMPNIRKLKIDKLNDQMFSMICVGWPNLESFDVSYYSKISDCGMTGLDDKDVKKINKNGTKGVWRPITIPRANITSLRYLQRLHISSGCNNLGTCAAVCGIKLLPNLKHLKINSSMIKVGAKRLWKNLCAQYPWPK